MQSGELGTVQYINCYFASTVIDFFRGDDKPYGKLFPYSLVGPGNVYSDRERSGGRAGASASHTCRRARAFHHGFESRFKSLALMDNLDVESRRDRRNHRLAWITARWPTLAALATLQVSDPGKLAIQVNCERGWIDFDFITGAGKIRRADGSEELLPSIGCDGTAAGLLSSPRFCIRFTRRPTTWWMSLSGNGANESTGEIGWRTVELLDAAYRSAALNGQMVRIESLYK